jgi:hypothetical protein
VEVLNHPRRATVVVRLYRRRDEFGAKLLAERRAAGSRLGIRHNFDFLTARFTGPGRSGSPAVRFSRCRRSR